jgi:hypothetical protein
MLVFFAGAYFPLVVVETISRSGVFFWLTLG